MPHGSGHVGGGGFHGGGGGFHHHHHGGYHHHHHHQNYYGPGWGWGWGWYGGPHRYRRSRGCGWGFVALVFILVIIVVVPISIRFSGSQRVTGKDYAPGDTRIVSYSSTLCESLTLQDTSSTAAKLYLLREKPQLTGHDNFTVVHRSTIVEGDFDYLYYYLYPGSQFSVSTCLTSGTQGTFYLIKGTSKFNKWSDDGDSYYALHHFDIPSCSQGKRNYSSPISIEDQYYFVFYNPSYSYSTGVDATFTFDRVLYQAVNSTIASSCRVGGTNPSSCTLNIPYQSNYTALIVVDTNTNPDENISVDTSCGARVWVYVVIAVVPALFLVLCIVGIVVACVLVKRHHKKVYKPLDNPSTTTANLGDGNEVSAPPPFNPGYGTNEPPPPYSTAVKQ